MVAYSLLISLVYGLGSSVTFSTTLAWLQLQWSGSIPAVGLMSFLEDARSRDVLTELSTSSDMQHCKTI